ncbi:hypothetical protein AZI86_01370 [Bdellovibrio bacteriovorus]|uniref:Methyltransferase type 11 domain-containing protein n=1 Tax=Bdellovibrio bacteriovorus TaxID=959 RepID=A0A150WN04_BDEBC|nr:class I SAM-dependent methyltransferase [Bdellovibrio bacteriovorus]KYG65754.1 hypothetical protein AZI86_01370 [Bdellovibrio bacteriovorus]
MSFTKNKTSSNKTSNKDGYDQWSAFYDQYPNPTVAMDEKNFPAFWRHHTGKKILEIGCGTGRHTQKLVANGNQVTALDLSSGMLAVAKKKIESPLVTFKEADFIKETSLGTNYDVVLESLVLEHVSDLHLFFEKAARALKTKGDLYLSEIHPSRTEQGVMAHFKVNEDTEVHLTSHPHREEDFVLGAGNAGLSLIRAEDILGDADLEKIKPQWSRHLGKPMIRIWHFSKD